MTTRTTKRTGLAIGLASFLSALAPAPQGGDAVADLRKLATARGEVSRKIADYYVDLRLAPPSKEMKLPPEVIPAGELVEIWTRRVVDARLDAAAGADERVAILASDLERTKAIEAQVKQLLEGGGGPSRLDSFKAEFYRLDAEYRLAKEKAGK